MNVNEMNDDALWCGRLSQSLRHLLDELEKQVFLDTAIETARKTLREYDVYNLAQQQSVVH